MERAGGAAAIADGLRDLDRFPAIDDSTVPDAALFYTDYDETAAPPEDCDAWVVTNEFEFGKPYLDHAKAARFKIYDLRAYMEARHQPGFYLITARLRKLQGELESLLVQYTDEHPDVIALRSRIENLKKTTGQSSTSTTADSRTGRAELNPVYQDLKVEESKARVEVGTLQIKLTEQRQKMAELEKSIDLLERAVEKGWGDRAWLETDSDLDPLRDQPRFKALIERID